MKTVPTLAEYIAVLRRRLWLIVAIALAAVGLAILYSVVQTPMYMSSVNILINQNTSSDIFDPASGEVSRQADRKAGNEVRLLRSQLVTREAESRLGFEAEVEVAAESQVDVLVVTAVDADPLIAQLVAQTFSEAYLDVRRDQFINERLETAQVLQERIQSFDEAIEQSSDPADIARQQALRNELANSSDQLTLTAGLGNNGSAQIIDDALFPEAPFAPKTLQNALIAFALGLFAGAGIAFLIESLDNSIRNRTDLEALTGGLANLAVIPRLQSEDTLVTLGNPDGPESEAFRTFRAGLEFVSLASPSQVIQIASPGASAGKTTVAANLGVVMANAGKKVAIVDADLRRPRIHSLFDVPQVPGLSSVMIGLATASDSSHTVDVNHGQLVVLPSGPIPPGPSELLGSEHAERAFEALRKEFDVIIVDSAPVLPVADALMLLRLVDATIVVVNAKTTKQSEVLSTLNQLEQAGANVVGTVLNQVKPQRRGMLGYGYGYGYGYGHNDQRHTSMRRRFGGSRNSTGRHAGTAVLDSGDLPKLTAARRGNYGDPIFIHDVPASPLTDATDPGLATPISASMDRPSVNSTVPRAASATANGFADLVSLDSNGNDPSVSPASLDSPKTKRGTDGKSPKKKPARKSPKPNPVSKSSKSATDQNTIDLRLGSTNGDAGPPASQKPRVAAGVSTGKSAKSGRGRHASSRNGATSGVALRRAEEPVVAETDKEPLDLPINQARHQQLQDEWADRSEAGEQVELQRYIETDAESERPLCYEIAVTTTQPGGSPDVSFIEFRAEPSAPDIVDWQDLVSDSFSGKMEEHLYRMLHIVASAGLAGKWRKVRIEFEFEAGDTYRTRYTQISDTGEQDFRPERARRRQVTNVFLELARRRGEHDGERWNSATFLAKLDQSYEVDFVALEDC